MVIKIIFANISILLPADISTKTEEKLLVREQSLRSTILLVPHHGSKYSSSPTFTKAVATIVAIISCGANNLFGHPHSSALERYHSVGVKLFRTDIDGEVIFSTDGMQYEIKTFSS